MKLLSSKLRLSQHSKLRWRLTILGYGYALGAVVVFLMALNFSNNLLFTYSFLLVAIVLVNIFMARANIKEVAATVGHVQPGYLGDSYSFHVNLYTEQRQVFGLFLRTDDALQPSKHIDLATANNVAFEHQLAATVRGAIAAQPLIVRSRWPFGLIEVSRKVATLPANLVYPKPERLADAPEQCVENSELQRHEPEVLEGVRAYQSSDSPKRIHWQAFAKTDSLQVKDFSGGAGNASKLLSWHELKLPYEQRLNCLCYWLLFYQRQGLAIGLQLPRQTISPKIAKGQLEQCLSALAKMPEERTENAK
jgi:uncharacterized protein (DUF58 family)